MSGKWAHSACERRFSMSDLSSGPANSLLAKMAAGERAVGMIVRLVRGVEIVAIAKTAGFDCLLLDQEHNSFSLETISQICIASNFAGVTPLVRVVDASHASITRALECGALGVILPHIESAKDATVAIQVAKYPPLGHRSIAPCLPHLNFRPTPAAEAMLSINNSTMVVVMIESLAALEAVEEIAAVEGVDMLLVGANDMCNALGLTGEFDHPKLRAAFERVAAACKANEVHFGVGGLGPRPDLIEEMTALGARYATAGADVTFFTNAAIAQARKFK
ncbi:MULTISPECIES: aldolase/citrate lyase family protein [unclassified Mesorhizobium]|uniref:HpcH/HpaI aldolase family protein n=1 Tax=unclassified Mesorhizobium TaxID=325217 RepID=UPI001FDFCE15|nr:MULTISPECIES: aldolase/citrate lyase family protein [unclassified Mesorhizobium]